MTGAEGLKKESASASDTTESDGASAETDVKIFRYYFSPVGL